LTFSRDGSDGRLYRRGLHLEYFTVGYNILEACAWLSVALLLGLEANYLFGFWQADPIVGLIIVVFLFREGWEGWKESGEEAEFDE
jgi:Co/Zn/Cd efflux system component